MSEKEAKAVKLLDTKLDKKVIKTLTVCTVIMLIAILIHDGDHIRQAYNWGYTIPLSLWALNLTVYVLPVVTLFLARSARASATLGRRSRRSFHYGVVSHTSPVRLVHRQLGRMEFFLF